jgi:hypothetical protein
MFTRLSNFSYGSYRIANIDSGCTTGANIEMNIHLQKYEQDFLRTVLGECLYSELLENLETDSNVYYKLKSTADPKWSWLVNGKSYTAISSNCGCSSTSCSTHKWDGLIKKVASIDTVSVWETIMAPYIYFHWALNYRTLNLGVGEGSGTSNGASQENTSKKRVDAWNEIVQSVHYGFPNGRVSLNQFLQDHQTEFPTAQTVCLTPMTYYDI